MALGRFRVQHNILRVYDSYFGEKLLAEKLVKTWNFVFIKASFKNKKDSRNLTNRVLFNPVRASPLLRIPRCVIIIVVVDGFDLTLVMSMQGSD